MRRRAWIKQILNFNHKFPHFFPFVARIRYTIRGSRQWNTVTRRRCKDARTPKMIRLRRRWIRFNFSVSCRIEWTASAKVFGAFRTLFFTSIADSLIHFASVGRVAKISVCLIPMVPHVSFLGLISFALACVATMIECKKEMGKKIIMKRINKIKQTISTRSAHTQQVLSMKTTKIY